MSLEHKINELVNINFANAMVGLVVQEADTGKVLYERLANTTFVPASATKLFSSAAALHKLTPKFRFHTKIKYTKNQLQNGILTGPLAIEFRGDPSLTAADLKSLVYKVKQANVTTIKGDIIIDDSYFQGTTIGDGWSYDDTSWYYASKISALILDENRVHIAITPSKQLGQFAAVSLINPNKQYFEINAQVKTVTFEESENLCQLQVAMDDNNKIKVSGCWPINYGSTELKLAVQNSRKFIGEFIQASLREAKVQWHGKIVYNKVPAHMAVLAEHKSLPLAKLLPKILANSDNLYAEAITKTLGAKLYQRGSFKAGVLAIKNILQKPTGINFDAMKLVDGSGLSRYTLISPNQFTRLLYTMYHSPKLKNIYMKAFAFAGIKGTLSSRLSSFDTYENIHAKTGSMTGVSALSGYLTTRNNKDLLFTMIVNNTLLPLSKVKKIEDELCQVIINYAQ
jgi:D-alanyl-D-alanine carboxypeptidase/D-alanyl-D-alanine-endopeptidase (penicillin-binding protein 4)